MSFSEVEREIKRRGNEIRQKIEEFKNKARNDERIIKFTAAGIFFAVFVSFICLVIWKSRKVCCPSNNDHVSRSNGQLQAASMQSHEQAIALSVHFAAIEREQRTPSIKHYSPHNPLTQSIPSQEQSRQRFPVQGHQIQPYPPQQPSLQQFQQPPTTPQLQQMPQSLEICNQEDLPPRYEDLICTK